MNIINDPRIDPWGTPHCMLIDSEKIWLTCDLLSIKGLAQVDIWAHVVHAHGYIKLFVELGHTVIPM